MLSLAADSIKELSKDDPDQGLVDHKTKEFVKVLEVGGPAGASVYGSIEHAHIT